MSKKQIKKDYDNHRVVDTLYKTYRIASVIRIIGLAMFAVCLLIAVFIATAKSASCSKDRWSCDFFSVFISYFVGPSRSAFLYALPIFVINVVFVIMFLFSLILVPFLKKRLGKDYIKARKEYEKDLKNRNKSRKKNRDYTDDSI